MRACSRLGLRLGAQALALGALTLPLPLPQVRAEWQRTFKPSCGRWWPYLDAAHALAAAAPALTLTLTLTLTLARHAGGAQRARRAGRAADG